MNREPTRTSLWIVGPALLVPVVIVGLWHLTEWLVWWWRGAL